MSAAARITSIVSALDELLEPSSFADLGPNGLQVPGGEEARLVVTGVSAQRELIERAVELGAQLLLFKHDLALAAYHIPLDAHPEVGNNAILANALGCERHEAFGDFRGRAIGRAGTFAGDGVPAQELFARVREVTGREPLVQGAGPERVRRIGIVSGSAADALYEAAELGLDAFLTGEPREHAMADARELGVHFIAAGHYATETFGVRALGDWLAGRFGIEHVFVDVPNPV